MKGYREQHPLDCTIVIRNGKLMIVFSEQKRPLGKFKTASRRQLLKFTCVFDLIDMFTRREDGSRFVGLELKILNEGGRKTGRVFDANKVR